MKGPMVIECPYCDSEGVRRDLLETKSCPLCQGTGDLIDQPCGCGRDECGRCDGSGVIDWLECPQCSGSGEKDYHPKCVECGGTGGAPNPLICLEI